MSSYAVMDQHTSYSDDFQTLQHFLLDEMNLNQQDTTLLTETLLLKRGRLWIENILEMDNFECFVQELQLVNVQMSKLLQKLVFAGLKKWIKMQNTKSDSLTSSSTVKKSSQVPFSHSKAPSLVIKGVRFPCQFSVDGKLLYSSGTGNTGWNQIGAWTLKGAHICFLEEDFLDINALCVSPCGSFVAAGGENIIVIWNAHNLKKEHEMVEGVKVRPRPFLFSAPLTFTHIQFNVNSTILASSSFKGEVMIYRVGGNWPLIHRVQDHLERVSSLVFVSPVNLVTCCWLEHVIKCVNTESGVLSDAFDGTAEARGITCIAYSSLFGIICSCVNGTIIRVGELSTDIKRTICIKRTMKLEDVGNSGVRKISVAGNLVASVVVFENCVRLWSLPDLESVTVLEVPTFPEQIKFDPSGSYLVCGVDPTEYERAMLLWRAYE
jgi:WD40 repeat protein